MSIKTALNRTLVFMAADAAFIALSVWLAFLLRFDANIPQQYVVLMPKMIFWVALFCLPMFYIFRLYSFSWSYVSTDEIISLVKALTISFILLGFFVFYWHYPRSTFFAGYIFILIFCGGLRLAKRIYLRIFIKNTDGKERALIVGAGDAGEQLLRSILAAGAKYNLAGFVDDNPLKQNITIHGVKVLGKISDMPGIIKKYAIKRVFIALPSADNRTIKSAVDLAREGGVRKIKILPPLSDIVRGEVSFKNLKNVEIEDLLGREKINLDVSQIDNFLKNKIVLITGAAGSIGSELARQAAKFHPFLLILLDQDETGIFNISKELERSFNNLNLECFVGDINDKEKVDNIFKKNKIEIVFHAAAYKHVPLMEQDPCEAVKNNVFGTKTVADACVENNVQKFIFISTDKAVNPCSVMGATKRAGEMLCQAYNSKNKTKFVSVRFGNVLNSRGSVIPIFAEQIRRGGPVEVTDPKMQRYFMLISEACLLVMQAGAMGNGGEVFVLDMGEPVKIVDLAREMIRLSGFEPDKDIPVVFTGIRPGEKLFEELLTAEEGTDATQNKKIYTARLQKIMPEVLEKKLDELRQCLAQNDGEKIKHMLISTHGNK